MNDTTPVKKGLTLAWSIGLGLLFLGITTVLLLPATKNARIRFDKTQQEPAEGESPHIDGDTDAEGIDTDDRSTPPQSP